MNLSQKNKIITLQNNEFNKKCQYVSRYYYNLAERLNYIIIILLALSFLPVFYKKENTIFLIIHFCIDLLIVLLQCYKSSKFKKGTKLRNYFDQVIFKMSKVDSNSEYEIKKLVNPVVYRNKEKCKIQISNDGTDCPPGVKNWYIVKKDDSQLIAIFECQKQNIWWQEKMMKYKFITSVLLFTASGIILFSIYSDSGLTIKLFLSSPLIFKLSKSIYSYAKYICISKEIEGIVASLDCYIMNDSLKLLQQKIESRRSIPIININFFHKKTAKANSEIYNNIMNS